MCYIVTVIGEIAQLSHTIKKGRRVYVIFIDNHSRIPIYEQIKEQIIMLINTGVYKPDEQLPSIRALSKELNINVNTIKRALSELERDGVTYSVPGKGVFVSTNSIGNKTVISDSLSAIESAVRSGRARGVDVSEIHALVDSIYKEDENNA